MTKYIKGHMGTVQKTSRGDTIVEVLIAIAIAAFAIGISYATAQRSLQQAITARERNEALSIMNNQITDLKLRKQNTPTTSFSQFELPQINHFCLDDNATDPNALNWAPIHNWDDPTFDQNSPLVTGPPLDSQHPYNTACQFQKLGDGVAFLVDIKTQNSSAKQFPTNYQVIVRWSPLTGKETNQASIYYRF